MSTRWHQFSLRSLLLFTFFMAVLCSIGVCTHWGVSLILRLGGITGRIVARRESGYLVGSVYGTLLALMGLGAVEFAFSFVSDERSPLGVEALLGTFMALVGVILGGVIGGAIVREPPGK